MFSVGRLEENFGEDPFLVSQMGIAALRGLQGPLATSGAGTFAASTYLANASISVTSQAKHFAAYGAGSKDGYTPMGGGPGERTLFEVYLRPWRDFALAGGRGVSSGHCSFGSDLLCLRFFCGLFRTGNGCA